MMVTLFFIFLFKFFSFSLVVISDDQINHFGGLLIIVLIKIQSKKLEISSNLTNLRKKVK